MRAKKVNKSCDIEENKHLKKSFCKDIKTMDSNNKSNISSSNQDISKIDASFCSGSFFSLK